VEAAKTEDAAGLQSPIGLIGGIYVFAQQGA